MPVGIRTPRQYAPPATPQAFLETFFPLGLVRDARGIVGVWCVFLVSVEQDEIQPDVTFLDGEYVCLAVRTKAGHPFGSMDFELFDFVGAPETWPAHATAMAEKALEHPYLKKNSCNFAAVLEKAGMITPMENGTTRLAELSRMLDLHYPCDKDANARLASEHLAKLIPFAETLDPEALAFVESPDLSPSRLQHHWLLDRVWNGIDATFTPTAPLRTAITKLPQHVDLLALQWTERSWETDHEPTALLTGAVTIYRKDGVPPAPSFAKKFIGRTSQVVEACKGRKAANFRHVSTREPWRRESLLACLSARMPLDWLPSHADEWEALATMAEPLWMALQLHPSERVQHLVNAGGRWREYAETLAKATGGADIQNAVDDVRDMASAFHDQIQRPLAAMASGSDESRREMNEVQVRNMLFKGLSLTKILEASRRWHARQEAINAAISALSPELEFKNWRPGLPDWEPDGMRVTILTTRKELTDEGRDGVNDDGTAGLAHCVGGYSDRCRSGDSRILSVRRLLPSGGFVRLSTAEISVKATNGARELDVVQHRGHANGDAPPQPEAMLGEYLEKCRAGRLAINESELVPLPSSGGVMATCGYDWREPGNIEKAIAAWSPCLPRRIRGMAPEELAVPATRHDARHPSRAR